jgi:hypothetical protein
VCVCVCVRVCVRACVRRVLQAMGQLVRLGTCVCGVCARCDLLLLRYGTEIERGETGYYGVPASHVAPGTCVRACVRVCDHVVAQLISVIARWVWCDAVRL